MAAACRMPHYSVGDMELGLGSSLGNGHGWINLGTDGRIDTVFCTDIGEEVAGPLLVRYSNPETRVLHCEGQTCRMQANIPLSPVGKGRFLFHHAYQKHVFDLPGDVGVEETVFVPRVTPDTLGDECVVYYQIELHNRAGTARPLSVFGFLRLAGSRRSPVMQGAYDRQRGAVFAFEDDRQDWVRALSATRLPGAHAITDDFGRTYDADVIVPLSGETTARGDVLGCLEVRVDLPPGAKEKFAFVLSFTPEGRAAAESQVDHLRDTEAILKASLSYFENVLSVCQVMTPDPVINEGAFWSKVNMLRVLAHYPQGEAFTNEPGVSSNIVARDVVWFVYGCDHFRPDISRGLLDALARFQYEDGKVPEYYDARTGRVADYDLNINDGTPLFVLGVNHHVRSTGDSDYLRKIYDAVAKACRYILSQRDERGLVFCTATGVEVWGICGWRNVIPNYRINGAVTEVNAECAAALRAMGHMAENLGKAEDAKEFTSAAKELTAAINEHLLDKDRQLYLLNIDTEGRQHTDVTADEVFPVLFRVAEEDIAFRIIRRLNSPDFWTPAGLRTVSRLDPLYHPAKYVGLLGGVWPGMTWWYAFAAARYHPEFMVQGLRAAFEHYNRDPRVFNTVPGQFSEWFEGESLINRGMRLSPWEPPRFLWAAVEGVCGMMLSPGRPGIGPLIPPDWKWVAAAKVCYHGAYVTFFAARQGNELHVYANNDFKSAGPKDIFAKDVTDKVRVSHAAAHAVALEEDGHLLVAIGSCRHEAMTTALHLGSLFPEAGRFRLRQYASESGRWSAIETFAGSSLRSLGVRIEAKGYHILEFARVE